MEPPADLRCLDQAVRSRCRGQTAIGQMTDRVSTTVSLLPDTGAWPNPTRQYYPWDAARGGRVLGSSSNVRGANQAGRALGR